MNSGLGHDLSPADLLARLQLVGSILLKPVCELFDGVSRRTIPWLPCLSAALFLQLLCVTHLDYWLFDPYENEQIN